MWKMILALAAILAPFAALADAPVGDDDTVYDNCMELCEGDYACNGQALPCSATLTECENACLKALGGDHDPFNTCDTSLPCAQWLPCVCNALGFTALGDDDATPADFDPYGKHHSGCGVASADPSLALFLAMTAIGVFAFAYGRRGKEEEPVMRRFLFLLALALAAPGVALADGVVNAEKYECYELCYDQRLCGALPCQVTDCDVRCFDAIGGKNDPLNCDTSLPCAQWQACFCNALGSPIPAPDDDTAAGDDASAAGFDPYGKHHSGCGVASADPSLALFLTMTAIGVFAFAYGRKAKV